RLPQGESERTRTALREHHNQLVLQQRSEIRFADHERRILLASARFLSEQLILDARDVVRSSHVRVPRPASWQLRLSDPHAGRSRVPPGRGSCRTRGSLYKSPRGADTAAARCRTARTPLRRALPRSRRATPENAGAEV